MREKFFHFCCCCCHRSDHNLSLSRTQTWFGIRTRIRIHIRIRIGSASLRLVFGRVALGVANSFVIYRCAIRLGFGHSLRCDATRSCVHVCVYLCVCSCFMGWNRLESSSIVVVYINIYLCMRSSRQLIASPESHLLSSIYTPLPFPSPNPLPHPFLPLTPIAAALTAAGAWQRRCCAVAITVLSPPVRRQGDRGNCQWYMTEQYMHISIYTIYILYIW